MADYNSAIYDEQTDGLVPDTGFTPEPSVEFKRILFTVPAGIADTETVNLYRLPVGSVVRPALCKVISDGAGTGVSIELGDVADDNRYLVSDDVSTAGLTDFIHSSTLPAAALTPYEVEEANQDLLMTVGMTTWPAGSELVIELAYENY